MCGHTELKPSQASMGSLFQMLGFTLPQPSNRGNKDVTYEIKIYTTNIFYVILSCLQEEAFVIFRLSKYCNLYSWNLIHHFCVALYWTRYLACITAITRIILFSKDRTPCPSSPRKSIWRIQRYKRNSFNCWNSLFSNLISFRVKNSYLCLFYWKRTIQSRAVLCVWKLSSIYSGITLKIIWEILF